MKRISPKRRKLMAAVWPWREALKARVGRCEHCGAPRMVDDLCVHEIANGNGLREKALDKEYAVLVLCRYPNFRKQTDCHREVQEWSEPKQLALLYHRRSSGYDLMAYLKLTRPAAMQRITQDEVDVEVKHLLKIRERATA